jgi:hypothetical protein
MEWLIAFSIVLPFFLIFLSIPSWVAIYKIGLKEYIKRWKSISLLKKGLILSYKIEKNQTLNYNYPNGKVKTVTSKVVDYYYPIFKDSDVIIVQSSESSFSTTRLRNINMLLVHVLFNRKVDGRWIENTTELKTSQCPWQQLWIDMVKKKLIKLRETSIKLENVNKLEEVIYSDLLEIDRDNKINLILNE